MYLSFITYHTLHILENIAMLKHFIKATRVPSSIDVLLNSACSLLIKQIDM